MRHFFITFILATFLTFLPSFVSAQTGSYKIDVTKQGMTQASIVVTSTLSQQTIGSITVSKPASYPTRTWTQVVLQSGIPSSPYVVTGLAQNVQYTVSVIAYDTSGKVYRGSAQFCMGANTPTCTISPITTTSAPTTTQTGTPQTTTSTSTTSTTTPTSQQSGNPTAGTTQSGNPTAGGGVYTPSNTSGQSSGFLLNVKLQNPLKVSTVQEAVKFFVDTLIRIAIPFIVVFFIWSGLKFILARGNPAEIIKAKTMFWYTVIGTLLILGAWTITNAIIGTVNSITS